MNPSPKHDPAFDNLLEDAAPPTLLLTADGILFGHNAAAVEFLGSNLARLRGHDILDRLSLTPGALLKEIRAAVPEAVETNLFLEIERGGHRTPHMALAWHFPQSHDPPLIKLTWDRRVGGRGSYMFSGADGSATPDTIANERRLRRELEETVEQLAATSQLLLRREREVRLSEERYALAVQGAGIWDWNLETNDIYYSPYLAEVLGYGYDEFLEVIGESIKTIVHPDDLRPYLRTLNTHLQAPEIPYSSEHRFRTKSGEYRWFQARGQSLCNDRGKPIRMTGFISDIHRLKETEAALLESEARLKEAQRIAQIGDFSRDLETDRLEWSEAVYNIFGLDPDGPDVPYDRFKTMVHPDDIEQLEASIRNAAETKSAHQFEYRIIRPDGTLRWIAVRAHAIADDDGQSRKLVGTVQDITCQKDTEAALNRAKEDAEYANRTKSEFLAHMSHELRTPLNSILGFSEIISQEMLGSVRPQYREYSVMILDASRHLLKLINDVLDLSKIEAGNLEIDDETVDTTVLIDEVLALLAHSAEQSGVRLLIQEPGPDSLRLLGDERRLKQILVNLVNNAIKFSPDGEVRVSAALDQGCVNLTVADTGCGIAPADIPIILDPFTQIRDNAHLSMEGTGLGLNLSKRLTELHGGGLAIESEIGRSTVVTATFPAWRTVAAHE